MSFFKKKTSLPTEAAGSAAKGANSIESPVCIKSAASTLGGERAANNRCKIFSIGLLAVLFGQGVAIMNMLPLKERIPYFIDVETSTGRVTISERVVKEFKPETLHIKYHIKQWAENLYTLDSVMSKKYLLPAAAVVFRGDGRQQYSEWLQRERPIERLLSTPDLTRKAEVISINFINEFERVALIRLRLREGGGSGYKESYITITARYIIAPPSSEDDAMKNPIGLYITSFNVAQENL